jgi:DNA-directed RNA polymerase subunit RPC12/RpoP
MEYSDSTLLQLKVMCKDRGLKVSGSKDEVIIRLMEDDEGKAPSPQVMSNYSPQNTHTIPISGVKDQDAFTIIIAIGIIVYSIFRGGVGLIFLTESDQIFASMIAILIGGAFMFGGILTARNYKNGLVITMAVLVVSGILSLVATSLFGGINPLSIDLFDHETSKIFSMMCSAVCMVIVGVPLLVNMDSMKPGFPLGLEDMFSSQRSTNNSNQSASKVSYECPSCSQTLRIPSTYSGIATCPKCKQQMEI